MKRYHDLWKPKKSSRSNWGKTEYKIVRNWTPREVRIARAAAEQQLDEQGHSSQSQVSKVHAGDIAPQPSTSQSGTEVKEHVDKAEGNLKALEHLQSSRHDPKTADGKDNPQKQFQSRLKGILAGQKKKDDKRISSTETGKGFELVEEVKHRKIDDNKGEEFELADEVERENSNGSSIEIKRELDPVDEMKDDGLNEIRFDLKYLADELEDDSEDSSNQIKRGFELGYPVGGAKYEDLDHSKGRSGTKDSKNPESESEQGSSKPGAKRTHLQRSRQGASNVRVCEAKSIGHSGSESEQSSSKPGAKRTRLQKSRQGESNVCEAKSINSGSESEQGYSCVLRSRSRQGKASNVWWIGSEADHLGSDFEQVSSKCEVKGTRVQRLRQGEGSSEAKGDDHLSSEEDHSKRRAKRTQSGQRVGNETTNLDHLGNESEQGHSKRGTKRIRSRQREELVESDVDHLGSVSKRTKSDVDHLGSASKLGHLKSGAKRTRSKQREELVESDVDHLGSVSKQKHGTKKLGQEEESVESDLGSASEQGQSRNGAKRTRLQRSGQGKATDIGSGAITIGGTETDFDIGPLESRVEQVTTARRRLRQEEKGSDPHTSKDGNVKDGSIQKGVDSNNRADHQTKADFGGASGTHISRHGSPEIEWQHSVSKGNAFASSPKGKRNLFSVNTKKIERRDSDSKKEGSHSLEVWCPPKATRTQKDLNELDICISVYDRVIREALRETSDDAVRRALLQHQKHTKRRMLSVITDIQAHVSLQKKYKKGKMRAIQLQKKLDSSLEILQRSSKNYQTTLLKAVRIRKAEKMKRVKEEISTKTRELRPVISRLLFSSES